MGVKSGRCVGLTTVPPSVSIVQKLWGFQLPGAVRVYQGL